MVKSKSKYWNGKIVSFQTRDYTEKQAIRYLACPMKREEVHHKHIVYTKPNQSTKIGFAVEGITDVWRFYEHGFATFGIEYTSRQLREIADRYDKVFILFDPETQAQIKAEQLKKDLEFRNIKVMNIILNTDPGDLSQKEADDLTNNLIIGNSSD